MPGKYGDILWSLPTVRAVSDTYGVRVDLMVSTKYSDHAPLLRLQPYIGEVIPWVSWSTHEAESAWGPFDDTLHYLPLHPPAYDRVLHLGYRSAPDQPLPEFIHSQLTTHSPGTAFRSLDLSRPWIQIDADTSQPAAHIVAVGWSQSHVDLKDEITRAIKERFPHLSLVPVMPRIDQGDVWRERSWFGAAQARNWIESAARIAGARFFLGCCSALHVLACAMGKAAVLIEPDAGRWDQVFYPYGSDGSRVRLIRGADGQPTCDPSTVAGALAPLLRSVEHHANADRVALSGAEAAVRSLLPGCDENL